MIVLDALWVPVLAPPAAMVVLLLLGRLERSLAPDDRPSRGADR